MANKIEKIGNVEIRYGGNGDPEQIDEIVIVDQNGDCIFHLEQMDYNYYWIGINEPKKDTEHFSIKKARGNKISFTRNK